MTSNLPDNWHLVPLSELGHWKGGGTPSKSVQKYWGGQIPWVSPKDFIGETITDAEDHITQEAIDHSSTSLVVKDSILIVVRSGILRKRVPIARNMVDVAINQDLKALTVNKSYDVEFIVQALKTFAQKIKEDTVKVGTTVESIDFDALKRFNIPIPSLPEQRKIAEILSTWDEAIAASECLLASLRQRKKGLMQRLLTGQVRFAGFEKSTEKRQTMFGGLPADWDYVPISDVAQQVSVKNTKGHELPVLSCTKYDGLVDSLAYFGRQIFSQDTSTYKVVQRGQFAYATNHIEEGSIGYQDLYEYALISPMYTVFETTGKINNRYLYLVLKTETYRQIFEQRTSASVNRRGSLRWKEFSRIEIPLPKIEEQRQIANLADSCDHELSLHKRKLEALKRQKRGLMQQLLTGRIRVRAD